MSTRGAIGFYAEFEDKQFEVITYNHFDSYVSVLGFNVLRDLRHILTSRDMGLDWLRDRVFNLRVVSEDDVVTDGDVLLYRQYSEDLSGHLLFEWYALLRRLQGDLLGILDAGIILAAHPSWKYDGMFNEYMYIVNLSSEVLECYAGFCDPHKAVGRYKEPLDVEYYSEQYSVTLVGGISFEDIEQRSLSDLVFIMRDLYGEE